MANIALYPGGYKPPHIGHYKAAKIATQQTDKVIVFVGPKEREGITQDMSIALWKLYTEKDNIEIRPAGVSPVKDVYDFVELEAEEAEKEKDPSKPVNVPSVVPLIDTLAPVRGSLDEPSTTTPETRVCENEAKEIRETTKNCNKIL